MGASDHGLGIEQEAVEGEVIVCGYSLDVYCDTEGCRAASRHLIQDRFAGHSKAVCIKQAKVIGWHMGYKHQYCPCCTGKMVFEDEFGLERKVTLGELRVLPRGSFGVREERGE